jgi:hypothetical protein
MRFVNSKIVVMNSKISEQQQYFSITIDIVEGYAIFTAQISEPTILHVKETAAHFFIEQEERL